MSSTSAQENISDPPSSETPWTVDKVLSEFLEKPKTDSKSPIAFFHLLERLKTTKREGWRRFGIDGESIADHMYRMAIITMCAPASLAVQINLHRCTVLALVHDMAEALVGDITPVDGVSKPEKSRREEETMDYLCTELLGNVDGGIAGLTIRGAWQEYEDSITPESLFVHDVDKVELVLQMIEYEKSHGTTKDLSEFAYVCSKVVTKEVKEWCDELMVERKEYWSSKGEPSATTDGANSLEGPNHKTLLDAYYSK